MSQYLVLYKYTHPASKNPITNSTPELYALAEEGGEGDARRFAKSYSSQDVDTQEVFQQNTPNNPKYDMLFMYNGVVDITAEYPELKGKAAPLTTIMMERFARCAGEPWFVASRHPSLNAAVTAATPLAKSIGTNNVRIVKNVPLDVKVMIK